MGGARATRCRARTDSGWLRRLARAASFASAGAALSCTHFASDSDTLEGENAAAASEDGDCLLPRAGATTFEPSATERLTYSLRVVNLITRVTPTNLRVRPCFMADLACTQPLMQPLGPDADGIVRVPLPLDFNGYLELTSDDASSSLLVFAAPLGPELAALLEDQPVLVVPLESVTPFVDALRVRSNPATGTLLLNVLDCAGQAMSGIRVLLDPPATPFSIIDGLPIAGRDTTTTYGVAGFLDVQPGVVLASGFRADSGEQVNLDALPIRAGWDSIASLLPVAAAP